MFVFLYLRPSALILGSRPSALVLSALGPKILQEQIHEKNIIGPSAPKILQEQIHEQSIVLIRDYNYSRLKH